ncbi:MULTISPECIES: DoxX family protein [Streptomyces]|uniref:DoxX family protein n=1 Tax=Streptomyces TaxID=1883 RepID=UPI000F7A390B|nr:DoxX family protein [Streptomyces sp. WAC05858]RSS49208.1 DoxX family membrane protein [Streptomyces sp. WAC05858]WTA86627.1 DoxX family protein [Streptomyces antimycoticus]WTB11089.1 DoxX family protein [Streptomyces antimycoticus]
MTTATTHTTSAAPAPAVSRRTGVALWATQIALALFFAVASGFPKLAGIAAAAESFDRIGYGDWFMYLVGGLEVAGAIGLLVPRLAGLAALALTGLMAGAEIFLWAYLDTTYWYTPLILAAILGWIAYGRRRATAALFRQLPHRAR